MHNSKLRGAQARSLSRTVASCWLHRDENGGFNPSAMAHTREEGEMLRKTEVGRAIGRWANAVRKLHVAVVACGAIVCNVVAHGCMDEGQEFETKGKLIS
eukprot:1160905-Pelagomonas_calceolata.AAC.6